jgi:uncharacterized protein with NRDE domain
VSSFLLPDAPKPFAEDVKRLTDRTEKYAGFNLLVLAPAACAGELSFDATYVTNHGSGGVLFARSLTPAERACGGLSNGIDGQGASEWPKVQMGTLSLRNVVASLDTTTSEDRLLEQLFEILR